MKKIKDNRTLISILIFSIAISLLSLLFFSIDPDYLWHIKAGEYMFKNGIITHDVFSWVTYSKYWMSHEWLFEIIIYFLKYVFGNLHLIIYCGISIVSLSLILFLTNKKNYSKNIIFTLIWILLFLFIIPLVQARPHLLSYNLFALTIYFLYDLYNNEDSKKIYFLPLISIIWANVHGGSSNLPYILCFIFLIVGLFEFKYSKIESKRISKIKIKKYFFVMILCMIAVCINAHGIKMFIYPYENILDSTMLENISEWQGTTLSSFSGYLYFGFLIFNIIIMLLSKKKIQFIDFMLFGFVAYLGIKSIRFWFFTYIMMSFIIFNYVSSRREDNGTSTYISLFSLFIIIFSIFNFSSIVNPKYYYFLDKDIINKIKEEKPKRLFNMYDYGGELVYNDIFVFIDGRADLYGKYNYKDYLDISLLKKNSAKLINKYDFDYMLVDNNYPLYVYLENSDLYESIYSNKKYSLYKKRNDI